MTNEQAVAEVTETRTEWRVESETLEDEFGTDEKRAREWLAYTQRKVSDGDAFWEPAVLMSRTVTVTTTAWLPAPPTQEHSPEQAPTEREGADDVERGDGGV